MDDNHPRDGLRAAYDAAAAARDGRELAAWKQGVRASFARQLRAEGHTQLLEVGAGPGHDGVFFGRQGMQVVCVDLSPEMVRLCQQKGLEAHVMDATDLRFPAGSFDAVYALNSLLHVPNAELPVALREIERVLVGGGLFFLGVYGGIDREGVWEEDSYRPRRFFSFRTDEQLLAAVHGCFAVVSFDRVPVDSDAPRFHFQSLILRKRSRSA